MGARPIAVIDIGTNSTRLLVAAVRGGRVEELERRTTVTRLGEGVDRSGRLAADAVERVAAAVGEYREIIDGLGADPVVAVATSAVRDAGNAAELADVLRDRHRVQVRTISGDEEARLTFSGATAGAEAGEPSTLVIDIGGGSTEYVVGEPGSEPVFHVSTQMGSVRHTERHLHSDPPCPEELEALAADADAVLSSEIPSEVRDSVERAIAVAGTPTSLAAIDLELEPYDSERVHGYTLGLPSVERDLARLAALPLDRRREVRGLHPDRAPTIVAGVAILARSLLQFGLEEVTVSEADILHGVVLAASPEGNLVDLRTPLKGARAKESDVSGLSVQSPSAERDRRL
jgi:exopolyphosphatase / guanosine-5'-triphosphate,3'-diphosphate pyrophosphatase